MVVVEEVHLKEMKLVIPKLTSADIEREMSKYKSFGGTFKDPFLAEVEQEATEEEKQSTEDEDAISVSISTTTSSSDVSDSEEQELGFVPDDLICRTCNVDYAYSNPSKFRNHLQTLSHQKKLQIRAGTYVKPEPIHEDLTCKICDYTFSRPDGFKTHLRSLLHQKNLQTLNGTYVEPKPTAKDLSCKICDYTFSGHDGLRRHLKKSLSHRKNLQTLNGTYVEPEPNPEDLTCTICDYTFSRSDGFKIHLQSILHQTNLREAERNIIDSISKPDFIQPMAVTEDVLNNTHEADQTQNISYDAEQTFAEELTCKICATTYSGPRSLKTHLQTLLHEKNLLKAKENPIDRISKSDKVIQTTEDMLKFTHEVHQQLSSSKELICNKNYRFGSIKHIRHHFKTRKHQRSRRRRNQHERFSVTSTNDCGKITALSLKSLYAFSSEIKGTSTPSFQRHRGRKWTCKTCNKKYSAQTRPSGHYKGEIHQKRVKYDLLNPQDSNSATKECSKCGIEFTHRYDLAIHICGSSHQRQQNGLHRKRSSSKPLTSRTQGGRNCRRKSEVQNENNYSTDDDEEMESNAESAIARSQSQFHRHFLCGTCGMIFKEQYLLKKHLIVHETEMPFSCEICDLNFHHSMDLQHHLSGNSHKRQVLKMSQEDTKTGLDCIPCQQEFRTREQYGYHLERPEHKKKCALYKRKENILQVGGNQHESESSEFSESETETDNYDSEEEQRKMINLMNAMDINDSS